MTDERLREMAYAAREIAQHIRRYWSVDGESIKTPLSIVGNNATLTRLVNLVEAWADQTDDFYPGPIIELQLRDLLAKWQSKSPYCGSPVDLSWLSDNPGVQSAAIMMFDGMAEIFNATLTEVPRTFDGEHLEWVTLGAEAVVEAIKFRPNEKQLEILDALDGRAMTGEQLLADKLFGSKTTLYGKPGRPGGLNELQARGYVVNDRQRGGYYRPDAPPD